MLTPFIGSNVTAFCVHPSPGHSTTWTGSGPFSAIRAFVPSSPVPANPEARPTTTTPNTSDVAGGKCSSFNFLSRRPARSGLERCHTVGKGADLACPVKSCMCLSGCAAVPATQSSRTQLGIRTGELGARPLLSLHCLRPRSSGTAPSSCKRSSLAAFLHRTGIRCPLLL
jgi:hypothetical protein